MNERIRVKEVRVIGPDGKQLGIMSTRDALEMAYDMGLDLVLIAPNVRPPVAKILDYGKFKYEEKKRMKQAKKKSHGEVKEISMRPNIGDNDLKVKLKKMREFFDDGAKVKVRIFFRGREMVHTDRGFDLADRIVKELEGEAALEVKPKLEGRNLTFMLRPIRKQGGKKNAENEDQKSGS